MSSSRDLSPSAGGVFSRDPETYRQAIDAMDDPSLIGETERQVWFSAFAANNPRAPAHWRVDACHDEAARRGKPWVYQEGWNRAYRSCGYEPSEAELARAIPPAAADTTDRQPQIPGGHTNE